MSRAKRHEAGAAEPPQPPQPPPPKPRGRTARWYLAAAVVMASIGLSIPWWGHDLAFFRIRRVEVRGTRFARPSDIAARVDIDTTRSIWSGLDSIRTRVEEHPQVRSARISRRLPGTLIVTVDENLPIALVPAAGGFRAYDEAGRRLPMDPSRGGVDLPITPRSDTAVFRVLAELKAETPEFYARISEIRRSGRDEIHLQLVDVIVRAMLDVSSQRILELSSVEADLERRHLRPVELDLRFKDQVIARLP
ncbi:MAG: FtsQ-type POTRA domain-containing protein [Gemmatimonadaceae bacterium]